jgi:hypothetical protein
MINSFLVVNNIYSEYLTVLEEKNYKLWDTYILKNRKAMGLKNCVLHSIITHRHCHQEIGLALLRILATGIRHQASGIRHQALNDCKTSSWLELRVSGRKARRTGRTSYALLGRLRIADSTSLLLYDSSWLHSPRRILPRWPRIIVWDSPHMGMER